MAKSIRKIKRDVARAKAKATVAGTQNGVSDRDLPGMDSRTPAMSPWVSLVQFGLVWIIIVVLASLASKSDADDSQTPVVPKRETDKHEKATIDGFRIPKNLVGPYTSYPNPLNITDEMRKSFHPVVKFPKLKNREEATGEPVTLDSLFDYSVLDLTASSSTTQLATEEQREASRKAAKRRKLWWQKKNSDNNKGYAVGKYDENRANLYKSDLFHNTTNQIDGYRGARTLHIGIDLDGPVGTNVYAFTDGVIHSAGYNEDLGDYGNVIVVEHKLEGPCLNRKSQQDESDCCKVWALYGHLDSKSIRGKHEGKRVKKGQVLGRMGDIHENGGWMLSHVHFQLAIHPPATHDMPGVVALNDRSQALVDFPDPRLVLGPLY